MEESTWIGRIITAGIIGMLGWTMLTVQTMSINVAVLTADVGNINQKFLNVPTQTEVVLLEQRIQRLEVWNERLSERINRLEVSIVVPHE